MAINNFFVKDAQESYKAWDNVFATWKDMDKDLGKYCAYYGYFIETDGSTPEYLRVAKQLSDSDSWRLQIDTGYYENGVQIVGTAKGCFPTFNHWTREFTSPGDYDLIRKDNSLIIGSTSFIARDFKDNEVPYCLGVLVQGAGGGGGGTWGSDDGTGGGAGGCIAGILKLDLNRSYALHVGAGGAGGYKKDVNSSIAGGGIEGEESYISVKVGFYTRKIFIAHGGGLGRSSTQNDSYAGGSGGTCQLWETNGSDGGENITCVSYTTGGKGGKVYGLSNATGTAASSASLTFLNTDLTSLNKTFPATRGGAQGDNNAPGGGGGSREYNGPAGGGYMSDGNAGSKGCGGSGARYTLFTYKRGGKGGDGYIKLFY